MLWLSVVVVALLAVLVGVGVFRLLRFATTPWLRALGIYRYYSPMFFTMPLGKKVLDMHLGTAWDFMWLRDRSASMMLTYLTDGLLAMCDAADRGEVRQQQHLRGTMYFLSPGTMEKFGFRVRRMRWYETLAFVLNYLEVCLLHSVMKRRLCWVDMRSVRIVEMTIEELTHQRSRIEGLRARLGRRHRDARSMEIQWPTLGKPSLPIGK
jgi:hypothetical protein